jgi:hypothetical protein
MQAIIESLAGGGKVILRDTQRAVTPFGGVGVFLEFLRGRGFMEVVRAHVPFALHSPNAIAPAETFLTFVLAVVCGARRFAHTGLLKADRALRQLCGLKRFAGDDTVRNFFLRFGMGEVERFYAPLWAWLLAMVPERAEGYSLDLDSTVLTRYGTQEGAKKGYNPHKRGRRSHHPLVAALGEAQFILHGWLRSGNTGSAQGVVAFLKEALARWPARLKLRWLRADSGFFDGKLLDFLESLPVPLPYMVVARMTHEVKRQARNVTRWVELDANYAVGEFTAKLLGWSRPRRFIVIREREREDKKAKGRVLIDVPGYTFRVIVTSRAEAPLTIWRDYNGRATLEQRLDELKNDLGADGFCLQKFFATEAAFRAVLLVFNLLNLFQQQAAPAAAHRRPATLRATVFLCGAILGKSGHRDVLHLSLDWGGLEKRKSMFDNLMQNPKPTSPKFGFPLCPAT